MFGRFMLRRLREPSTWAGIVTVVTAVAGLNLDPAQREAVIAAGVSLVGVLLAFTRESGETDAAARDKAEREVAREVETQPHPLPPHRMPNSPPAVAPDIGEEREPPPTRGLQGRVGRNR